MNNYCRNPDPVNKKTIFCYTMDPLVETEYCVPLRDYQVFTPQTNILGDNHLRNISYGLQPDVAYLTNTMTLPNKLDMNLEM
jgi:hypothetical protein